MNKIETTKLNSNVSNSNLLKDSGLTPTVWEQAQLSQDLFQSLDGSIEQFDSSINQLGADTVSLTSATKADTKDSKTISNTNSLTNIADPLLNLNSSTLNSSLKASKDKVDAPINIAQATFDPNYDIRTRFYIEGGSPKFAEAVVDGERVDPKRRKVGFELLSKDNRKIPGSQTWVVIHGWNGDLGEFRDLGEAVRRAKPNDTVLVLDWRQAAVTRGESDITNGSNYHVVTWVRPLAEGVFDALTRWGINPGSVNFIGHSFGSYVSSEVGRVFVEETGQRVNTITALDPANEANIVTGLRGYDVDIRRGHDGIQRPAAFNEVSNFSRSFIGYTSGAGSPENSSTAHESIVMDFGGFSLSGIAGGEHGWIINVFRRMIDPNPTDPATPLLRLARNPLIPGGSPYLFSLDDYQVHSEFNPNSYKAYRPPINNYLHEGVMSAIHTGPGNISEQRFFIATQRDNPSNNFVYGTTGDDEILLSTRNNVTSRQSKYFEFFNNSFFGDDGNDRIQGGFGNDGLYGGKGNDNLDGSSGRDTINGVLDGDPEARFGLGEIDRLTGGLGSDTFVLGDAAHHYYIGGGNDDYALIADFNPSGNPVADIVGRDFIQLKGAKTDYRLALSPDGLPGGTAIYRNSSQIDVLLMQDVSESFTDDRSTLQGLARDLFCDLQATNPNTHFGLGSFGDYAVAPFGLNRHSETITGYNDGYYVMYEYAYNNGLGYGTYYVPGEPYSYERITYEGNSYVYQTNQSLTTEPELFLSAINNLPILTQADEAEAQLEALFQVANGAASIGFRNDAARFVVLSTDAPYHMAGDGLAAGVGVEYSTISTVKEALKNANIIPIFAVTENVSNSYEFLVAQLGVGAVVSLTSDSSNIVNTITNGLNNFGANNDLVGIVQNVAGLSLDANYFSYV